jgi:hypothetical protein
VDGKHTLHGSASEDGNILMLIENYLPEVPTSDVSMVVGIKKSSGMSNSDLNGEYIFEGSGSF